MIEVRRYVTSAGKDVFGEWLARLRDLRAKAKIATRIDRVALGNFGDCKSLREGLYELRIDFGPGYRVYYSLPDKTQLLLLGGGDKRSQYSDIENALVCLRDYKKRTRTR